METTAVNNGQKKKLALKSQDADGQDRRYSADPSENQTPSYSAEVELKGMKWTPGHIFMLYYAVLAVFASGDRTSSL